MTTRPIGAVISLDCLLTPPLFKREILLYVLESEGFEIICHSTRGRGTTRRILRETGLLHYFDDLWYNEIEVPDTHYHIVSPDDPIYQYMDYLTMLYQRGNPLTHRLNSLGGPETVNPTTEDESCQEKESRPTQDSLPRSTTTDATASP